MSTIPELIIDSVNIPFAAAQDISQTYTPLEAKYVMRTGNGSAIIRTAWKGKLSTTISGTGVLPAGFSLVDWSATHTLYCIASRAINSGTTTVLVPKARRTDTGYVAYARAITGYKDWVPTTYTSSVYDSTYDQFSLTAVSGVTLYQVMYFPKITVIFTPPEESLSDDAFYSWSLSGEEV
jgi:hypothetical protein